MLIRSLDVLKFKSSTRTLSSPWNEFNVFEFNTRDILSQSISFFFFFFYIYKFFAAIQLKSNHQVYAPS